MLPAMSKSAVRWLTLALLAYVGVLLLIDVPWDRVIFATLVPPIRLSTDYLMLLVGVLGTTISPYLFFWQASQEVEEQRAVVGEEPLRDAPEHARRHLRRRRVAARRPCT